MEWNTFITAVMSFIYCPFWHCCNENWIKRDIQGLRSSLANKLHGQHLATHAVLTYIDNHIRNEHPSRALVLSLHGTPGVGKTYISQLIAQSLYRDGFDSPYVHFISATNDYPHPDRVPFYKEKLKSLIERSLKQCDRSMFILDEVDKIPPGLLDVIKPFIDYQQNIKGINNRRAIFIFLSNAGGSEILEYTLDHWRQGKKRESLTLNEMENNIMLSTLNAKTHGLKDSQIIAHHLITAYIPFLPLEKKHVRQCIQDDLKTKGIFRMLEARRQLDDIVDEVMGELTFFPPTEKIFSVTGCKRITEKVDFVTVDKGFHSHKKTEF